MVCWKITDVTCIIKVFIDIFFLILLSIVTLTKVASVEHTIGIHRLVIIVHFRVLASHEVRIDGLVRVNLVLIWIYIIHLVGIDTAKLVHVNLLLIHIGLLLIRNLLIHVSWLSNIHIYRLWFFSWGLIHILSCWFFTLGSRVGGGIIFRIHL
jgi:hypothetical protein